MGRPRFALAPLLQQRRLVEERGRQRVAECASACARAHEAWLRAVGELQASAREAAVLARLEARQREAWLVRERRREEREAQDYARARR
jgi:hypothetical protein